MPLPEAAAIPLFSFGFPFSAPCMFSPEGPSVAGLLCSWSCRTVFALIVINKAGGLIYIKTFHEGGLKKISTNDYLVLAGTFHG